LLELVNGKKKTICRGFSRERTWKKMERQTVAESLKTSLGPPSTRSTLEEVGGPRVAVYKRTENSPIVFLTTKTASHLNSRLLLDRLVEQVVEG
jgi:hypothetical protein